MFLFRHLVLVVFIFFSNGSSAGTGEHDSNYGVEKLAEPPFSIQKANSEKDTIVIRFEYKQSALFHKYTLETLDSIIDILLKDTLITLAIDGYAYKDEGDDSICYYLSLNRAKFVQTYILGRGIQLTRIKNLKAWGRSRQEYRNKDAAGLWVNCRVELRMAYPPPPKKIEFLDRDEDGIEDEADKCPDIFGIPEKAGCPMEKGVIIPFALRDYNLISRTYRVLDSVISVLKADPALSITIDGHANLAEGIYSVCQYLASERADIVKRYLESRQINPSRIIEVKSYGVTRPLNAAKNVQQILENARAEIRIIRK